MQPIPSPNHADRPSTAPGGRLTFSAAIGCWKGWAPPMADTATIEAVASEECDRALTKHLDFLRRQLAKEACRAALAYDEAIQIQSEGAARLGKEWTGGDDLDALYVVWISLAKQALGVQSETLPPGDDELSPEVLAEVERLVLEGTSSVLEPAGLPIVSAGAMGPSSFRRENPGS